jgi:hypothetical protein
VTGAPGPVRWRPTAAELEAIVTRQPKPGTPAYYCRRAERTLKVFAPLEELVPEPAEQLNPLPGPSQGAEGDVEGVNRSDDSGASVPGSRIQNRTCWPRWCFPVNGRRLISVVNG